MRPTFPLSDFKTKHIFGILMERVKFLKPFGAPQAPPERGAGGIRNLVHRRRPKFLFFLSPQADAPSGAPLVSHIFPDFFHRRRRQWFSKWAPQAPQRGHRRCPKVTPGRHTPGGRGKSRRRRVFREYISIIII